MSSVVAGAGQMELEQGDVAAVVQQDGAHAAALAVDADVSVVHAQVEILIEQQRQVVKMAGDRVLSLPARATGTALVVAADQAQVVDDAGDRGETVGDSGPAVDHDHGKPLRNRRRHIIQSLGGW
ncbi:hypothetical protein ACWEJ6_31610 [Nonomuraea sp. NPDC004702]